ncbi:conserved hypothetical protein [Syntrophobacter sp. SbD1]|nr:conserved hypothetical protein [Syntrophobacter sp. SbD1]
MSYYCHITPGRLRIKTPIIKQNPVKIEQVRRLLESFPGVETVSINALTGSIIINYSDCTTNAESILNILREKGYYHFSQEEQPERAIETVVSRVGTTVGKVILGAAVEKAFEGSMLSLLAFLV